MGRWRRAAAALVLLTVAGSCTPDRPPTPEGREHSVDVTITKLRGFAPRGAVPRKRLRAPARKVGAAVASLYEAAFVDPAMWEEGKFPAALRHFRGRARTDARRDRTHLTLGPAATRLEEVRPRPARVRISFLVDARRRPLAALADVRFEATGVKRDGGEMPIGHRGRYLLRRARGRWVIDAYHVRRRLAPESVAGVPTRGSLFVLAIGSDARPGTPPARALADSIHIVGVNLEKRRAAILGIPRDSYVGGRKINAALYHGGPQGMVRAVEELTGIRMDGYLLMGFEEFRRAVNAVGRLEVRVPYRMADAASGAYFQAGKKRMTGHDALAFSRNRKGAPGGDFGRSLNQGEVILAALRKLRQDVRKNPLTLFQWVTAGVRHVETDLSPPEVLPLLVAAVSIEPGRVQNRVVPGSGGFAGGQSIVRLGPGAHQMFRDLARNGYLGG